MFVFEQMNTEKNYHLEHSEKDIIKIFQNLVENGKRNLILIEYYYKNINFNHWIRLSKEFAINLLVGTIHTFKSDNQDYSSALFLSRNQKEYEALNRIQSLTSKPFGYRFETISNEEIDYFHRVGFPIYTITDGVLFDYKQNKQFLVENQTFSNNVSFSSIIELGEDISVGEFTLSRLDGLGTDIQSWIENIDLKSNWGYETYHKTLDLKLDKLVNWNEFNSTETERLLKEIKWLKEEHYDILFWVLAKNKINHLAKPANSFRYFLLSYALGLFKEKSYIKLTPLNSEKIIDKGFCLVTTRKDKMFFVLECKKILSELQLDMKHPIEKDMPLFETLCKAIAQNLYPNELKNGIVNMTRLIEQKDDYDDFKHDDKEEFYLFNQIYFALYPEEKIIFNLAITIQENMLYKKVVSWDKSVIVSELDFSSNSGEITSATVDNAINFKIPLIHWKTENQKPLNGLN